MKSAAHAPLMTFAVVTPGIFLRVYFLFSKNHHFAGMVDTGLGKKSMPSWLWHSLKPLRYLLLKHPDEGTFVIDAYNYKT
jgi:hypothetical protein